MASFESGGKLMTQIKIGTVSEGTIKPQDLIPCFVDVLTAGGGKVSLSLWFSRGFREMIGDDDHDYWESGACQADLDSLFDALDQIAPDYCRFSAHPDDGADFGFWPDLESLDQSVVDGETIKINDLADLPDDLDGFQHVMLVTDHGNVTLYTIDTPLIEQWSIV
jgi:hypothetical protein